MFIVEFIGNGVSARAVIKKGSLSLVHRSTIAGHLLYILDEKNKFALVSEQEFGLTESFTRPNGKRAVSSCRMGSKTSPQK